MKIDVRQIVRDHLATLRDASTGKRSSVDIMMFYILPGGLAFWGYCAEYTGTLEIFSLSVTFFGIFVALLLNLQVAAFAISQRHWKKPEEDIDAELQQINLETRNRLLSEINANISYLVLASCLAIVLFLTLYSFGYKSSFWSAIGIFLYAHFILTLLMVVKRSHALFQNEYKVD